MPSLRRAYRSPLFTRSRGAQVLCAFALLSARAPSLWAQLSEQDLLLADDAAPADLFGGAVALSGDRLVVGASLDDNAGGIDAGSVYVYRRSGGRWIQESKVVAAEPHPLDHFGTSVAMEGATLVVGAPDERVGRGRRGAVHVFVRSGSSWEPEAVLLRPGGAAGDRFGEVVALSGDTVLVGARLDDVGAEVDAGSASVFVRNGTSWSPQADLPGDARAGDAFGASVALVGDTALVGAWGDDHAGGLNAGAVRVFTRSGTAWTLQQELHASDAAMDDGFGAAVALSGDRLLIGARQDSYPTVLFAGSAYVFERQGGGWVQQAKLAPDDLGPGSVLASFGSKVALFGDRAVVGSFFKEHSQGFGQGAAYLFELEGGSWRRTTLIANNPTEADEFGIAVALSADTAVVGAWRSDLAEVDAGTARTYWVEPATVAPFGGNGVNLDVLHAGAVVPGLSWSASVALVQPYGSGGVLILEVRPHVVSGPTYVAPLGGRTSQVLIGGPRLGRLLGAHDGAQGAFAPQSIPLSAFGLRWAAQVRILGGGFDGLTNAVHGEAGRAP